MLYIEMCISAYFLFAHVQYMHMVVHFHYEKILHSVIALAAE